MCCSCSFVKCLVFKRLPNILKNWYKDGQTLDSNTFKKIGSNNRDMPDVKTRLSNVWVKKGYANICHSLANTFNIKTKLYMFGTSLRLWIIYCSNMYSNNMSCQDEIKQVVFKWYIYEDMVLCRYMSWQLFDYIREPLYYIREPLCWSVCC